MLLSLWLPAWAGWGPWDLIRVDEPGHPDALASSAWGSVLEQPPEGELPWRVEPQAELDISYQVWEAREALEVQPWHDAGFLGQGVRVAVMDYQWQGAEGALASLGEVETHDCWAHDACTPGIDLLQPTYSSEDNVHGVACAEVIRALAPEAELHLLRVNNLTTFENAAEWAIREGIDLVSMSMSFYSNSFYDGSGPVNAAAERMSEAGVLLVTSAGNSAEKHWMESWRDEDHDRLHEFPSGSEYLPIYFQQGQRRVLLEWDQYANCGDTDLGARVYSEDGRVVGRSDKLQSTEESSCDPQERVQVQADEDGWYYLQLERVAGDPSTRFSLFVSGGELYEPMPAGSIADPGTHPDVLTVAAVRANGYLQNGPESFSSQGPTHGGVDKPDIAGPDGLTTSAYGGINFYGTSAAAPAVTGALALIMSREPHLTPQEAAEKLQGWAKGDRELWQSFDYGIGAGRARLPDPELAERGCLGAGSWAILLFLPWPLRRRD